MNTNNRHGDKRRNFPAEFLSKGYQNPVYVPFFLSMPEEDRHSRRLSLEPDQDSRSDGSESQQALAEDCQDLLEKDSGRASYGSLDELTHGMTLTWRNLSVYVPHDETFRKMNRHATLKQVLNNVSGVVKSGTLLAVLGSSGAGKSTLISALAQRIAKDLVLEGDILVNGRKVDEKLASLFGYVDQHDLFVDSLSVKEHLLFMARMKMDKSETLLSLTSKVKEVITSLGLAGVQNARIGSSGGGGISGGEKKRLSFATEILTDPFLLFCDEPTTGLDSYNAKKLVKILRGMAARGKTIICTIHQPSSEIFALFDGLLLLTEGRIAFLGDMSEAPGFLEGLGYTCPSSYNPADFYIHTSSVHPGHEVPSRDRIDRICNAFEVSKFSEDIFSDIQFQTNMELAYSDATISENISTASQRIVKPGFGVQLYWLTWRSFVDSYRDPMFHRTRILQRLAVALLLGACFAGVVKLNQTGIQNIQGAITMCIAENIYPCLFGVLYVFGAEIPVFLRDYKNGVYGCAPYYLSKMITLIPGFFVWSLVFALASYWLIGLQNEFYPFIMTLITFIVVSNVSSACGLMFSALFEGLDTILMVLVPLNQFTFITNGFSMRLDSMPEWLSWTKYLTFFFFSTEIVSSVQWEGVYNITCDQPVEMPCIDTGEKVLEEYQFDPSNIGMDFFYMILLYFLFNFIGFLGLRRRAKRA